jgi:hypothetical protein
VKRSFCAGVLALIVVASPLPAHAQTPEAEALGLQIAHAFFSALPIAEMITEGAKDSSGSFAQVKSRPEWGRYMLEAMTEEVRHDMPAFERMFGRALARHMSLDELKAGAVIMADPGVLGMVAASAGGPSPTAPTPGPAAERAAETPAGRAFLDRLGRLSDVLDPLQDDFVAELMPGAFRRFADKVEAGEARRAQSGASSVK